MRFVAIAVVLSACTKPTPAPDAAPAESQAAATESAAVAWADQNHDQRAQYMKEVVMPAMAKSFQGFNAEEFANMDCTTCHGPGAKEGKFDVGA